MKLAEFEPSLLILKRDGFSFWLRGIGQGGIIISYIKETFGRAACARFSCNGIGEIMDITSRKNERAVRMKKLGSSKEFRRIAGEFLCDGKKLLQEAVKSGAEITQVFACGELDVELPGSVQVYSVTREVIEAVSPLKTPQDVVFSVKLPGPSGGCGIDGCIVLENMQDPGNVGTVLRTANAFGIKGVILTGACADPWGPKAVRATMGAIFRQNIREMTLEQLSVAAKATPLLGAALSDRAVDMRKMNLTGCAVAVGSEGSGLTEALLDICSGQIIIPMRPDCESLNAAAAASIIMWEMSKSSL